jgi:uncharacterized protein
MEQGGGMGNWKNAVSVAALSVSICGSPLMAQNSRAMNGPPSSDKAVTNGTPGKTTNTGVLRSAQDDGKKEGAGAAKVSNTGILPLRSAQDDGKKEGAGAAKVSNTGVLPFRTAQGQDDGKKEGAGAAKVSATPAIWRVKGAHGTVYLFGTIHVMKPDVDWQTAKVKAAFAASDTVYVEVANLDDKTAGLPLAAQFGLDMAHPLSTKIGKDDVGLLDAAAKRMGLPGESTFEPMQPWLVTMTVGVMPMLKAGYDPASGVDVVLLKQARDAGKKIVGLETMEQQLHFVADEPQAEQVEMLHKELTEIEKNTAEMADMVAAWERGEVTKIGALENGEMKTKYAAEYKTLVVDRNTKWAATLDGLLKDASTGTVFVAVGAAHLAGDDSVIEMLKKDGWKVERQ